MYIWKCTCRADSDLAVFKYLYSSGTQTELNHFYRRFVPPHMLMESKRRGVLVGNDGQHAFEGMGVCQGLEKMWPPNRQVSQRFRQFYWNLRWTVHGDP